MSADEVHAVASVELNFLKKIGASIAFCGPVRVRFSTLEVRRVDLNFMMSKSGEFNINGLVRTLAAGEVRSAMGGVGIHHLKALKLPNVLRVQIHGARGLRQRPKMRPRVIVRLRQQQLATGEGQLRDDKGGAAGGSDTYFTFDLGAEMLFPLTDPSAVLHIKVVNGASSSVQKPALLGQWIMTTKYLVACPHHCKHSRLDVRSDGALTGTFLLCDAKMHGSTVRSLGSHTVGKGYECGELDMTLHWTHCPLVQRGAELQTNCRPSAPRPATDQLNQGSAEDALRLGNLFELKALLSGIPIRFDIDHLTLRKVVVEMTDIFASKSSHAAATKSKAASAQPGYQHSSKGESPTTSKKTGAVYIKELAFAPFDNVSIYDFLETFALQARLPASATRPLLAPSPLTRMPPFPEARTRPPSPLSPTPTDPWAQAGKRVMSDTKALSGAVTEIFGGLGQEMKHMTGLAMGKLGSIGKGKSRLASSSEPSHEHDAFEFFK